MGRKYQPRAVRDPAELTKPLGLGPQGEYMWDLVTEGRPEILTSQDAPALETLCHTWQNLCDATRAHRDSPDRLNRVALNSFRTTFMMINARFGLTPSDRRQFDGQEEKSAVADLRARFVS